MNIELVIHEISTILAASFFQMNFSKNHQVKEISTKNFNDIKYLMKCNYPYFEKKYPGITREEFQEIQSRLNNYFKID